MPPSMCVYACMQDGYRSRGTGALNSNENIVKLIAMLKP